MFFITFGYGLGSSATISTYEELVDANLFGKTLLFRLDQGCVFVGTT
jgi:hypothetical protein